MKKRTIIKHLLLPAFAAAIMLTAARGYRGGSGDGGGAANRDEGLTLDNIAGKYVWNKELTGTGTDIPYWEFFSDGTYKMHNSLGMETTGKFEITGSNTVNIISQGSQDPVPYVYEGVFSNDNTHFTNENESSDGRYVKE